MVVGSICELLRKWNGGVTCCVGGREGLEVVCCVVVVVERGRSGTGDKLHEGKVEVCLGVVEGGRLCEESRGWQCRGVVVVVRGCS